MTNSQRRKLPTKPKRNNVGLTTACGQLVTKRQPKATTDTMGNAYGRVHIYPADREHQKLEILKRVHEFPIPLRETIQETKPEDTELFLSILEDRLVGLLYGIKGNGLDCSRDTHQEIETAIRFFPHVLSERYWGTHPPIYAQLAYLKSVPFIPLLARLGIEYKQFQKEERGGLFYKKWNVLRSLVNNDFREWYDENDDYHQNLVDKHYAAAIRALRDSGIFRTQDIREQDLIRELYQNKNFPEHRFRCLVDYDPEIFYSMESSIYNIWPDQSVFRTVFEIGFFYFPTQFGFVFHVDNNSTPFSRACHEFGTETATKIIGHILSNNEETMDTTETLIHAATNPIVHWDALYFLLRRDPSRCHQATAKACR